MPSIPQHFRVDIGDDGRVGNAVSLPEIRQSLGAVVLDESRQSLEAIGLDDFRQRLGAVGLASSLAVASTAERSIHCTILGLALLLSPWLIIFCFRWWFI